jgi:hypothetical protein
LTSAAHPVSPADAVSGRDAGFGVWISGAPLPAGFDDKSLASTAAAVRGVLDAVEPWSTGALQINFCGSENTAEEAANAAQSGHRRPAHHRSTYTGHAPLDPTLRADPRPPAPTGAERRTTGPLTPAAGGWVGLQRGA